MGHDQLSQKLTGVPPPKLAMCLQYLESSSEHRAAKAIEVSTACDAQSPPAFDPSPRLSLIPCGGHLGW
jgi:hypothetical protein